MRNLSQCRWCGRYCIELPGTLTTGCYGRRESHRPTHQPPSKQTTYLNNWVTASHFPSTCWSRPRGTYLLCVETRCAVNLCNCVSLCIFMGCSPEHSLIKTLPHSSALSYSVRARFGYHQVALLFYFIVITISCQWLITRLGYGIKWKRWFYCRNFPAPWHFALQKNT